MYTFAILKNLAAFFGGETELQSSLAIGCIALVLVTVMHVVMLVLLWPFKMKKTPMKGVRRFPAIGAAAGAVLLIVSFIVNAATFLPAIQARKNITAFRSFEAVSLTGGEAVTQDILQGKVTILNIWETTCGPCKAEMPDLEKISQTLTGSNVQIIGLCYDIQVSDLLVNPHSPEEARAILNDRGVTYLNLQAGETLNRAISGFVSAFPTTVVLDENGNVLELIEGSKSENGWLELVQKYQK